MSQEDYEASAEMPADSVKDPSKLSDGALYFWLKSQFKDDYDHCNPWHKQAKEDFAFKASKQWDVDQQDSFSSPGAGPPIVFNMSLAVISAVAGIEINQRHEVVYLPRGTDEGQIKVNELLTGTSQWMGQECDAEDEESEAFEEALDCGMGCTENRMDYDVDPDGMYIEESVPIREMFWDKHARKKNIIDAKRVWRARKMPLAEARELMAGMGVDVEDSELDCTWASFDKDEKRPQVIEERREKKDKGETPDYKQDVTIVHAQWVVKEVFHRVVVRGENDEHHLTDDQFQAFKKRTKEVEGAEDMFTSARQTRKVYWEAFIGGSVLLKRRLEKHTKQADGTVTVAQLDRFTYQFITGYLDKTTGHWMGLISLLRDPQKLINKSLQKMIHILSTTAAGGILAEKGAFGAGLANAQKSYAKYDAITEVAEGALARGKIVPKPGAGNIAPFAQLVEYAIESLWRVVGLNPEIMGMVNNDQPGILEYQRKQAAMTILAKIFDSLRRFRKNVGRLRLFYMQNFISDGRIVRINGQDGFQAVKLIRDNTLGEYDVIVDDAPTSPNQKELTFSILMQLLQLPELQARIDQDTVMLLLEYSPLPSKVVDGFRKKFAQGPTPEQQQQQQLAIQSAIAKIQKDQASTAKDKAAAAKNAAEAQVIGTDPTVAMAERSRALAGLAAAVQKAHAERHAATAQQMGAIGAAHRARSERVKGLIAQIKGMQDLAHAEQNQAANYQGQPQFPALMAPGAPTTPTPEGM